MDMAEPSSPKRGKIGLKATSHAAGVGTITRISFSEDDDGRGGPVEARVSLRYGPKPKRDKKGMSIGPWPETSEVVVPATVARKLEVGMKCRVSLEPVGAGHENGGKAKGGY